MRSLVGLEGFTAATYRGTRADFEAADRRLILQGTEEERAFFSGRGIRLEADSSITYDDVERRVRTRGATNLLPETGEPLRSRTLIYDLNQERGTAVDAETVYTEGAQWIVRGDLDSVQEDLLFGSSARFTTCDLPVPHSYFRAGQLKVINNQVLVARSVQMYVADVPVLWLPFIAQNLGSGRASGLLTPTFSVNDIVRTSGSYNRRITNLGYYWAMSDYSDLSLALDWYSDNYTAIQGGFRYRWAERFLNGVVNYKYFWGASGRRERSFNTNHSWDLSERTSLRASGRYVSSESLVNQYSLDPRETTSTVDSDANLNRRFDWGTLTLGASRKQYLTEDRTSTTLPSANLSLSTLTFLDAPAATASWYNNISLSGSMGWDRQEEDRGAPLPDSIFAFNRASRVATRGSASGSLGLGDLSLRGNVDLDETTFRQVPGNFFLPYRARGAYPQTGDAFKENPTSEAPDDLPAQSARADFLSRQVTWTAGLSYQQQLLGGGTTLTPNLSMSGELRQVDSIPAAENFVEGPTRLSTGVTLRTDLYGFYPGFGSFEAIRHKFSPSITFSYAPEVTSTDLQRQVFGERVARARRTISFGFNQTWEARQDVEEVEPDAADTAAAAPTADPEPAFDPADPDAVPPESDGEGVQADQDTAAVPPGAESALDDEGLARLPPSNNVVLLSLQTIVLNYDLVQADSIGGFIDGFTTTQVSSSIRSDYLRGLDNLSFTFDLFDDSERSVGGPRLLDPHLSQLSFGFGLDEDSGVVQALGRLLGAEPEEEDESAVDEGRSAELPPADSVPDAPLDQQTGFDPNQVIPGESRDGGSGRARLEGWQANFRYSLTRPRATGSRFSRQQAQTLSADLSFAPTEHWTVDWRTAYDMEERRFLDHIVSLRRDLHEWEASFSFAQTTTGNWSFQFEVALRANQDLRFDYQQRSLQGDGRGLSGGF
ncbi:MAG: putative LPS assembly protein LptD [Gemmatimonadota bacterium]